jgi:hypothetical protein
MSNRNATAGFPYLIDVSFFPWIVAKNKKKINKKDNSINLTSLSEMIGILH